MTPAQKHLYDEKDDAPALLRDHIDTWGNGPPSEMRMGFEAILNDFKGTSRHIFERHQNIQWLMSRHNLNIEQAEDFLDWQEGDR